MLKKKQPVTTLPRWHQLYKHNILGIRLVGGNGTHEGRVEVYHDRQWGTVCDDGWEKEDAEIVCTQLGLFGGTPVEKSFGEGSGNIWMDDIWCRWEN